MAQPNPSEVEFVARAIALSMGWEDSGVRVVQWRGLLHPDNHKGEPVWKQFTFEAIRAIMAYKACRELFEDR